MTEAGKPNPRHWAFILLFLLGARERQAAGAAEEEPELPWEAVSYQRLQILVSPMGLIDTNILSALLPQNWGLGDMLLPWCAPPPAYFQFNAGCYLILPSCLYLHRYDP